MPTTRNPERTRTAILDAAEGVFAEKGYDAAGLQEIADRAGVSRGTPSYFYGSKDQLYRAVLERAFGEVRDLIAGAHASAAVAEAGPEAVIGAGVEAYFAYLVAHPTFVRLVQWETLGGGRVLREAAAIRAVVQDHREVLTAELARGAFRPVDPDVLLICLVALCWVPVAHADTLLAVLGVDPRDPAFVARYARHLHEFVLHGIAEAGTAVVRAGESGTEPIGGRARPSARSSGEPSTS